MATRQRFRPCDLLRFLFVGDPRLSPDGGQVAFVRTRMDARDNGYRSEIWAVAASGAGAARPLTAGPRDSHPRWSPDGRYLAFLREHDGRGEAKELPRERQEPGRQLWVLPLREGGEARPLTRLRGTVVDFAWAPDARRIAFVTWVKPEGLGFADGDDADEAGDASRGSPEPGARPEDAHSHDEYERLFRKFNADVRRIEDIRYRLDGFGYYDHRRAQVFVVDVPAALGAPDRPPRPVQVTEGPYDHMMPAWSPDGSRIAVSAARGRDWQLERYSDIWVFPADGAGEPVRLTRSAGPAFAPSWSPNGGAIAYLGHARPRGWYSNTRLWTVRVTADGSAEPRLLTAGFDRSFGDHTLSDVRLPGGDHRPTWSPDGAALYGLASTDGTTQLFRVDAASGRVEPVTSGDHVIFDADLRPELGLAAAAVAHADNPNDIYILNLGSDATGPAASRHAARGTWQARRLTRVNEDLLAARVISLPERFRFAAAGGPEAEGWVIRPAGGDPGGRYPAVLAIHGGPMALYTSALFFEFQLLASEGIGVIYTNPRGSQGYGEAFCAAIEEGWGEHDYADLMAAVDAASDRFGWIDPERLGVSGGSYGGYMAAWITGQTDRFRAACVMRPVINCYSFFGTSDTGYAWDEVWTRDQAPWEVPDAYLLRSPIAHAGNVRTPTLIEAQEQDYRCPIEQAEQWYVALKKRGVEAVLIRYPGESHGMSRSGRPWHRIHRLREIVDWFSRHLSAAAEAPRQTRP